jgi:TolA-binding protein
MSFSVSNTTKVYVFFSYAHRDKMLRDKLEDHLSILKYRGLIAAWHDREIIAGEDWAQQIDIHLNTAHIILLLISSNFMASGYCYGIEMKRALERHERGEAHVVPVLLRPVLFTEAPFAKLQMLPTNAKAVATWRNRDSAFVDIALNIERLIQRHFTREPHARMPANSLGYPGVPSLSDYTTPAKRTAAASSAQSGYVPQPYEQGPHVPPGYTTAPTTNPAESSPRRSGNRKLVSLIALSALLIAVGLPSLYLGFASYTSHPVPVTAAATAKATVATANANPTVVATATPIVTPTPIVVPNPNPIAYIAILAISLIVIALLIWAFRFFVKAKQLKRDEAAREVVREKDYYEQALRAYKKALRVNPSDSNAHRGMGHALYALGHYDTAILAFERAVRNAVNYNTSAAAYIGMGNALAKLERYDDALAIYEHAIALDSTFAPAYNNMSNLLEQLGRDEDARQYREKARQLGYTEDILSE